MKIRIELENNLPEEEIVIKVRTLSEKVQEIEDAIKQTLSAAPKFTFFKENKEYFFPVSRVIFFETDGEYVFAHTASDLFKVHMRLYELEEALPKAFLRISKSTIVNIQHISSIERNITSSSLIQFQNSHKEVYVSRLYYKILREKLDERRYYEV